MPQGGAEQRSTRALVTVDVLDVNDNAPTFEQETYTAVIPENAPSGVSVVNITATDPDEDKGGVINYEIIDEGEASGEQFTNSPSHFTLPRDQSLLLNSRIVRNKSYNRGDLLGSSVDREG